MKFKKLTTTRIGMAFCGMLALLQLPTVLGESVLVAKTPSTEAPALQHLATLTTDRSEDEFPAIGCDTENRLWVAWVAYDGTQDRVRVSKREKNAWSESFAITERPGDHWRPSFGRDGTDRLWLTWSQNDNQNWDIWGCYLQGEAWSTPIRLTRNPDNDISQKLATDSSGQLWMVWQSVVKEDYEILLARLTPGGLKDQQNVSEHPLSDWEPAIAADGNGRLFVVWDSYRCGNYDIFLRLVDHGRLGELRAVTSSPAYEAHATAAVDRRGRLWVAWDQAGPHWGQHGDARRRLHSQRSVHLCCLEGNRRLESATLLSAVLPAEFARFCELPELVVDGSGRLGLFVRHLRDLTPPGRRSNGRPYQARGIWNPYVLFFSDGQWSKLTRLPDSNGRNDMRLAACRDAGGRLWAAWADDGRRPERAEEPVNHNMHVAQIETAQESSGVLQTRPAPSISTAQAQATDSTKRRSAYTITAKGKTYHLLFGDTHRHTDISRCSMNYDGSLIDTYRYAIDAADLDFLAISDHDQDLLKHRYDRKQSPLLGYAWWRSQKYCDLFYIADRFLTIYGYEHGGSFKRRGGHKNVLYLHRGMPCYEQDSPEELFRVLQGKDVVVIPHQLADGPSATDWSRWDPEFEHVAEIFQARGSYEFFGAPPGVRVERKGFFLWDALAKGVGIGVIASSDHGLVHSAYAAVYATEFTRQAVLEALRNRRSYGATDTLIVDLRLGDHLLGQKVNVDRVPTFDVSVRGTAPLKQVQIVRNGSFVYTTQPGRRDCHFRYTDSDLASGTDAYYYVRCEQQNSEWAWSSAIWVARK